MQFSVAMLRCDETLAGARVAAQPTWDGDTQELFGAPAASSPVASRAPSPAPDARARERAEGEEEDARAPPHARVVEIDAEDDPYDTRTRHPMADDPAFQAEQASLRASKIEEAKHPRAALLVDDAMGDDEFIGYVPTSPAYSPTSPAHELGTPAYAPTSPRYASEAADDALDAAFADPPPGWRRKAAHSRDDVNFIEIVAEVKPAGVRKRFRRA
jgi:hypothetical protein